MSRFEHNDTRIRQNFQTLTDEVENLQTRGTPIGGIIQIAGVPTEIGNQSSTDNDAATAVLDYVPENYLYCNGQQVSIEQYPELFEAIGKTYNLTLSGDIFELPTVAFSNNIISVIRAK